MANFHFLIYQPSEHDSDPGPIAIPAQKQISLGLAAESEESLAIDDRPHSDKYLLDNASGCEREICHSAI